MASNSLSVSKKADLLPLLLAARGTGFVSCGDRLAARSFHFTSNKQERKPLSQHPTSPGIQPHQALRSHVPLWIHDWQELVVTAGGGRSDFFALYGLCGGVMET